MNLDAVTNQILAIDSPDYFKRGWREYSVDHRTTGAVTARA
jgi:hypothetical protein